MQASHSDLWSKINSATQKAIAAKALYTIPTQFQIIQQQEIPFLIRIVDNLKRKEKSKKKQKKQQKKDPNFNPFLPFDKNLFVEYIYDDHVLILNKFNVADHHLLIITRDFESQTDVLNLKDFIALWHVLYEVEGLGFYNGGTIAGSSQPHKHLQLVPYPFALEIEKNPLHDFLLKHRKEEQIINLKELPYSHKIAFFDNFNNCSITQIAQITLDYYLKILQELNIELNQQKPSQDYNLLVTREWMMVVPRRQDSFQAIAINSLGFAGAFLVKNESDLELIKKHQPLQVLAQVAVPCLD